MRRPKQYSWRYAVAVAGGLVRAARHNDLLGEMLKRPGQPRSTPVCCTMRRPKITIPAGRHIHSKKYSALGHARKTAKPSRRPYRIS